MRTTLETVIDKWKCLHGSEQRCEVNENGTVLKKGAGGAAEGESDQVVARENEDGKLERASRRRDEYESSICRGKRDQT